MQEVDLFGFFVVSSFKVIVGKTMPEAPMPGKGNHANHTTYGWNPTHKNGADWMVQMALTNIKNLPRKDYPLIN